MVTRFWKERSIITVIAINIMDVKGFFRLLVILVSVLCLTAFSCSKKKTIGEPYILYEVHGKVIGTYYVDNTDTPKPGDKKRVTGPLKGIKVTSDSSSEPATTSENGLFVVYGRSVPSETVTIAFEDVDGDGNHGTFLTKTQMVTLRQRSPGGDRNYEGYWIATGVEVSMLLKDDELNTDPEFEIQ